VLRPTYDRNLTSYFARSQPTTQRTLRKNIGNKSITDKAIKQTATMPLTKHYS